MWARIRTRRSPPPSAARPVRLTRLSRIGDGQLAALYRGALCLCVPSFAEGFCLPVLEAQALGCPVVCSDRSATPEIAGAGALTFDPADAAALAACLRRLLDEPGLRSALIARGHDNARRYDWAETARRYEALLLDALRDAAGRERRPGGAACASCTLARSTRPSRSAAPS